MNGLVSMLVPLQTLPGWPVAPTVSWLHAIGLLIGLPLVAIIIITTIGKVGARMNNNRDHEFEDRFALGGGAGGTGGTGAGAAVSGSSAAALPASASGQPASSAVASGAGATPQKQGDIGGASARW